MSVLDSVHASYQKNIMILLFCLHKIMRKTRQQGFLAIEMDVENPETSPLFVSMKDIHQPLVMTFIRDTLRLMLTGVLDPRPVELYVQAAITSHEIYNKKEMPIFSIVGIVLQMFAEGHSPSVAIEFGRQTIPVQHRPSFATMEALLREDQDPLNHPDRLNERADRFIQRVSATI